MSIEIKDVVSITGMPGLYHIVKADERAIVIESMDDKKKRQLVRGNMLLSKLVDISIYTETDSEPLVNVLKNMQEKFGSELPVKKKSSNTDLMSFLGEVLPDYDPDRVYPSNVKKLLGWYKVLGAFDVDLNFSREGDENEDEVAAEEETTSSEE